MRKLVKSVVLATLINLAAPALANDAGFTIAVIPDTQNYIDYTHQTAEGFPFDANKMFLEQMRFVADNLEANGGDVAFVTALGDIWQHQTKAIDPAHAARGFRRVANPIWDKYFAPTPKVMAIEIPTARKGYEMIAGKVPFSVVPGNHDYDAMWTDAKHSRPQEQPGTESMGKLHAGGLDNFRSVFGAETSFFKGKSWYVASHDGGADSAQVFRAGGYSFLHIGLQFDAPNASLEWAAKVIAKHPGLPTIVSTHDYLTTDAKREPNPGIDNNSIDPQDNTPEMVWSKFISQHDQIFLVLCGHEHGANMRVDPNNAGNKVWQLLSDYQGRGQTAVEAGKKLFPGEGIGDGWMRMMRFDLNKKVPTIRVRTYSSHYRKHSTENAQYAAWYKAGEHPKLSDEAFGALDEFTIELSDFRKRFGQPVAN